MCNPLTQLVPAVSCPARDSSLVPLSVQFVERQCVHEPIDDVEERKRQRKHSPRDSVDLARFLFTFRVDDARRTARSTALDHVHLHNSTSTLTRAHRPVLLPPSLNLPPHSGG